jgi:hypothetical protein
MASNKTPPTRGATRAKPSVKTAAKPAGKPAAKAVAKPAVKAVAKPAAKPAAPAPAPLVVELDGKPLAAAEAEETWRAFSAHMDEHQGDLLGFAKLRGWKSVAPTYRRGSAVLLVTTR